MKSTHRRPGSEIGLSLIDMIATVAIISTISAIAVPQVSNALDSMRLGMSARDVERELQYARLKAVSANRPMRIRFDCPSAGKVRVVEVIGTPTSPDANDADAVTNRCSEALYPYSPTGADRSRLTRPNNDGPVRTLYTGTTFTAKQTLEFWPNGTVHDITAGYPQVTTVTLTLLRKTKTKNITVNGLGKILLDR
jgi:Tfp pilus assembly protein FimT